MQQNFHINVISLMGQKTRREKMTSLLGQRDVEWSFVNAIPGAQVAQYADFYDRKKRLDIFGYDMRSNEIACFLSHRLAWQNCALRGVPFLILEDDVQLASEFSHFREVFLVLDEIQCLLGEQFLIRLGNTHVRKEHAAIRPLQNGNAIVRFAKDPTSAFAYFLDPGTASQLLQHSATFFTPVDDFMWRGWEHGCCMLDVASDVLFTTEEDNPSNIGDRTKPSIGLLQKMKREYHRFFDNKEKVLYEKSMLKQLRSF